MDHSYSYLDEENLMTLNSKNVITYGILADLVRGSTAGGPSLLEISSMIAGNVEIYFRNVVI